MFIREVERKLSRDSLARHADTLELFRRVQGQRRTDKNKVYSLHEPDVLCLGKGKEHKKYEFGRKASIALTKTTGIIVGAVSFKENIFDGHTLPQVLEQTWQVTGTCPTMAICDRRYRGTNQVGDTRILRLGRPKKTDTPYERRKARQRFRRRAGIEPLIGHLKHDHRMARSYLKAVIGDAINLFIVAAAFNFKKWMRAMQHFWAQMLLWMFSWIRSRQAGMAAF